MMTIKPVKTAVIGCGTISSIYLQNCTAWDVLDVVACADLDVSRAEAQAAKFGVPRATTVEEVLADPQIELIVNLTIPAAHSSIAMAAMHAGKSVYNEKPLTVSRAEGQALLKEARERGLRVGCAPDTFLGAGLQTCRRLIDAGEIGLPVAAVAFMGTRGPDYWHPDPAFLFKLGAGPLFDMGPYYITAMVSMFGPVRRVTSSARVSYPQRTIRSEPKRGTLIDVETPTHIATLLDFASGPIATLVTSFDIWDQYIPSITVYGSGGTLSVPDPNTFGGPATLRSDKAEGDQELALTHAHAENSRGLGVADLAYALRSGRPHRASGELAYHVLDVMHAALEASATGRHVELASSCERPAPLPAGMADQQLDEA
jgi:predicted dehydrogenase